MVVHEASGFAGFGAEVAARLSEACFAELLAPVVRVTGLDIPYPPPKLQHHHLPDAGRVIEALDRLHGRDPFRTRDFAAVLAEFGPTTAGDRRPAP